MSQQVNLRTPDLWHQRVDELGIRLETSPLAPLIERVYLELAQVGISFRPPCFVANEWGCPDGQPIIGIPFYLADARLHPYEEEHADDLEDEARILMGLRHEAGHAVSYAYKLYEEPGWEDVFGRWDQPYNDDYQSDPFSRRFVRHLPGWYGQKHPDEDFAETFAVWLTPGASWRERYVGWEALRKLEYIDQLMARIGGMELKVLPDWSQVDPDELAFTVGEFYVKRAAADAAPVAELGATLDDDLREIFGADGIGTDGGTLLDSRRRPVMRTVSAYTGARLYVVKSIIDWLVSHVRNLGLRAAPGKEPEAQIGITALISTLTAQFLRTGHFQQP